MGFPSGLSMGYSVCSAEIIKLFRRTQNVIATLTSLFARFGIPKILVTDDAPEFTSKELNDFCRTNGIAKMESPPYGKL